LAIAGTVLGLIGTIFIATVVLLPLAARHGRARAAEQTARTAQTEAVLVQAKSIIETHRSQHAKLPGGIEGNKLIIELSDGWGESIRYDREDDGTYLVRSAGEDGEFDTPDDLTSGTSRGH
jgi:hypothetical protein